MSVRFHEPSLKDAWRRNAMEHADRLGPDHRVNGERGVERYSESVAVSHRRVGRITRLAERCGLVINRVTTVRKPRGSSGGDVLHRKVDWITPHGLAPRTSEHDAWILGLSRVEAQCRTWGLETVIESVPLRSLRTENAARRPFVEDEWPRRLKKLRRANEHDSMRLARTSSTYATSAPATPYWPVVSKKDARVPSVGMATAVRLCSLHPCAPAVSRRLSMWREDADSQSKALQDFQRILETMASSPRFGLIRPGAEMADEGPQLHAGTGSDSSTMRRPRGGYRGFRVEVKGRLDGSRRTRRESFQKGRLPRSTISAPRSYGRTVAKTKYGTRGVSVYCRY